MHDDEADAQGSVDGSPADCRQVAVGNPDRDLAAGLCRGGLLRGCGTEGGVDSGDGAGDRQARQSRVTWRVASHVGRVPEQLPCQWAALLRTFLARAAVDVAEFGKKAQGTVHTTECLDQEQEWLAVCQVVSFASGRPSEYSQQGRDEKLGRCFAVPDLSDRVPLARAAAASLTMWSTPLRPGGPRWRGSKSADPILQCTGSKKLR